MASSEISESVIHAITPADCCDQYYAGEKNTDLQCFPTLVDNRFYVSLNSLNQGATNTIIFNPDQGLSDIVLTLTLPAPTGESGVGSYQYYAMPQNWASSMIDTVALRVGGSALYYFGQDQLFVDTLTDCETEGKKNALVALSGGSILNQQQYAKLSNRVGSVYLKMPFNSISALQKTLCLPTDLLTQPIQILVTFKRFSDVAFWYAAPPLLPVLSNLPVAFASAQVNFRKTTMQNSEHLLARRENMLENALTYPLRYFAQTVFRTNISQAADGNGTNYNTINLTGFRSGSLKYIDIWANKINAATGQPEAGYNYNFSPILSARLLINGLVMYDAQLNNAMWGLCEKKTPTNFATTQLAVSDGTTALENDYSSPWLTIPFAQLCEDVAFKNVVNLGYSIQNSVVNLAVCMEDAGTYQISAAYHYTASMLFTKNSAEYVF
jgi:hypothetical protein